MLDDLDRILPPGKLPGDLLNRLLTSYVSTDPTVVIGPGIGRDAAAIQVGDTIIVVKTDPITFATKDVGRYLVNVNANDIVCMGAQPRWLLVTALLPERSTTPRLVETIFASLSAAANELGISLVGGHTEITIGIDRPLLIGQMIGEVSKGDMYDLRSARTGDAVILCTPVALEGTAILAVEAADALSALDPGILSRAARLLVEPGISVLPAANAMRSAGIAIRGLHDPTEGGVLSALLELQGACGHGVEIWVEAIPVLAETAAICAALGLDPLGLIASGSLLAVVPQDDVQRAINATSEAGILAACVGRILDTESDSVVVINGEQQSPQRFEVDEIARYFASRQI